MKYQVISDIHTSSSITRANKSIEQQLDGILQPADGLILAGDISNEYEDRIEVLEYLSTIYKDVIFVLGNHDFCKVDMMGPRDMEQVLNNLKPNVRLLDSDSVEVNGKKIHGATLWYPRTPAATSQQDYFFDFFVTHNGDPGIYDRHIEAIKYFEDKVKPGDIIVTHHAPYVGSISPRFIGSVSNCFFVTDLSNMIYRLKPSLWIHGHVHNAFDYTLGDTRILCNPYGYDQEVGRNGFKAATFIEI